jgi:hypothetical protein
MASFRKTAMSIVTPINSKTTYSSTGSQEWIPLNKYGSPSITINIGVLATGTVTVQGTLVDILNQSDLAAEDVFDIEGLVDITTTTAKSLPIQPISAIRLNISASTGDISFHVQQNGS